MSNPSDTPVNLSEMDGDIVLQVPLAGTEPVNISIHISDSGQIVIRATARGDRAEPARWHLHEWQIGEHHRSVILPCPIDSEHANATYRNGVLTVSMPRGAKTIARDIHLQTLSSGYGEQVGHRGHAGRASKLEPVSNT